jgi:integrase
LSNATIADCWRHYEENHLVNTVSPSAQAGYWGRLKWFGPLVADGLSPREVERYVSERRGVGGASPGTINRELGLLRSALRFSAREGLIEKAPYITALPKPPAKQKALTREEASKLVRASKKFGWRDQVYIKLALGTGQRSAAILDLQWSQVDQVCDFRSHTDKAARMKRRAVVPMNDMVAAALKLAKRHRNGPYVLNCEGRRLYSPRDIVRRVSEAAGLQDVTPHVLRHTVASILLQEGEDLLKVSKLLGHASTLITQQVYFNPSSTWLQQTTSRLKF